MNPHNQRRKWLKHVRDYTQAGLLNNHANHIAHILAARYFNQNQEAWPTQQTLASTAGLSDRTTRQALHELERYSFLNTRKGAPAVKFGNVYTLSNPVQISVLDDRQHGKLRRVRAKRNGVGPKDLTPSHLYVSHSSSDGDQAFKGSTGTDFRVRGHS